MNKLRFTGGGVGYMNAMVRWDPFKEMNELHKQITSLFDRVLSRRPMTQEENLTVAEWAPLVDISETNNEYLIKAELPEVKKEDVKVSVENGVLTVSGERKFEKEEKGVKYHRVERSYGSFVRSFSLPDDADENKVSAEFKDGILKIHIQKNEKARPRAIEVKVE
jgi:HSP20 family protein